MNGHLVMAFTMTPTLKYVALDSSRHSVIGYNIEVVVNVLRNESRNYAVVSIIIFPD